MKRNPTFKKFIALLRGSGYNATNLSDILHKSKPTLLKRMRSPGDFSLSDIANVLRDGEIELDEILNALRRDLS